MELRLGAYDLSLRQRANASDEQALIDRCRRQDPEAFGRFVDLYEARLAGFIRRMTRSHEEAADLTQEAFIRAFQSFNRFDGRSNVKTWLFRIAYNLCIDRARRIERAPVELGLQNEEGEEWIEPMDERWRPDTMVMDVELMDRVEHAIGTMSEKLRVVLLMHDREDASYEEIAEMLKIPVGTVKSRLFLARTHLQNMLAPYLEGGKSL